MGHSNVTGTSRPSFGEGTGDDFTNFLFDPFGFFRTIEGGGNPLSGDPFGRLGPGNVPLPTIEDIQAFIDDVNASILTDGEKTHLIQTVQHSPDQLVDQLSIFSDQVAETQTQIDADEVEAQRLKDRTEALAELEIFIGNTRPGLQTDIQRFTGPPSLGDDGKKGAPGDGTLRRDFLQEDADFANTFAEGTNAINSNIKRARQNASLANVNSGTVSSGKTLNQTGIAEAAAAGSRAELRTNLTGQARGFLGDAKLVLTDFDAKILAAREGIKNNSFDAMQALFDSRDRQSINFTGGRDTAADLFYGDQGIALANAGLLLEGFLGTGGLVQNATDSFLNAIPGSG